MNEEQLYAMRHSLAHITAQAVQHLWPEAKFGVGPVVENGFYYDIDLGDTKISEADFKRIEKEMRGIINRDFAGKKRADFKVCIQGFLGKLWVTNRKNLIFAEFYSF